ncbi:DNA-primase RepB domain-containing protein [Azospirillum sp. B510]|uniref:DNA-primase RepB domain-containing protein n=1 Tax=Azospirillum sp. (strain B510) TaxID=137722 RepID=UPI000689F5E2|nr:DNA-primase RepB domain-containing protein [Azospirillum sp. B510]
MPQPTCSPATGPALQRVQALAGLVPSGDRTLDQVRRQLAAFGAETYEFQPLPPKGSDLPKERIRRSDGAGVERSLGWLKRMNMQGYDIYIRPAAPDGHAAPFVFVDDIGSDVVQRLEADGLPLAVGIESSPGRYHGWVRVGTGPVDRAEVTEAARLVAQRYGGDPSSADWRHYGRLAGFTNRKPERRTPSGQPFAMLRAASGGNVAPAAENLLSDARQAIEWAERARQRAEQERRSLAAYRGDRRQLEGAMAAFLDVREKVRTAKEGDQSARDYGAALALLRRGYTDEQVAAAMRQASPHAEQHRSSRDFDYAEHTVAKARRTIDSTPSPSRAPGPRRR